MNFVSKLFSGNPRGSISNGGGAQGSRRNSRALAESQSPALASPALEFIDAFKEHKNTEKDLESSMFLGSFGMFGSLRQSPRDFISSEIWVEAGLPDKVEAVQKQLMEGNNSLEKISSFMSKYSKLERNFAHEVGKLCKSEGAKLCKGSSNANCLDDAISQMLENLRKIAESHNNHAVEIENYVLEQIKMYQKLYRVKKKEIFTQKAELDNKLAIFRTRIQKQRSKCLKAIQAMDPKNQNSSFLKGPSDPVAKAYKNCIRYKEMLDDWQNCRKDYYVIDIPSIVRKAQIMEENRFLVMRNSITRLGLSLNNFPVIYEEYGNRMRSLFDDIFMDQNIESVQRQIIHFESSDATPITLEALKYDLPVSLKQLREQIEPVKRDKFGIGKLSSISLENIMTNQKISLPNSNIPTLFVQLRNLIRDLGGFQVEGIFRVSAKQTALEEFIELVKENDLSMFTLRDPHIPAAALKLWLRNLDQPLISIRFYNECINGASLSDQEIGHLIVEILNQLPETNVALIHAITALVREVSCLENVSFNKMSITNLAIVFAPSILRSGEDPELQSFIFNYNKEIAFIVKLFTRITINPALIDDESYQDRFNTYESPRSTQSKLSPLSAHSHDLSPIEDNVDDLFFRMSSISNLPERPNEDEDEEEEEFEEYDELPPGWTQEIDQEGNIFYWNESTQTSQWELPST